MITTTSQAKTKLVVILAAAMGIACAAGCGEADASAVTNPLPFPDTLYLFSITNNTGVSQNSLALRLNGDATTQNGSGEVLSGSYSNSFGNSSLAAYNSSGSYTTITYSGGAVANGASATVGFQWNATNTVPLSALSDNNPLVVSASWGSSGSPIDLANIVPSELPAITVDPYAIFELSIDGVEQYMEQSYSGQPPTIQVVNNTQTSETISGPGYFLSDSYIPLDQLNPGNYPQNDFNPLPAPVNSPLPSGGLDQFQIPASAPAPATVGLAAAGLVGLTALRLRKKRTAA